MARPCGEPAGAPPSVLRGLRLRLRSAPQSGLPCDSLRRSSGLFSKSRVHRTASLRANTTLKVITSFFRLLSRGRHRLSVASGSRQSGEILSEHARNTQTHKRRKQCQDSDGKVLVPVCPVASIDMPSFFPPEKRRIEQYRSKQEQDVCKPPTFGLLRGHRFRFFCRTCSSPQPS